MLITAFAILTASIRNAVSHTYPPPASKRKSTICSFPRGLCMRFCSVIVLHSIVHTHLPKTDFYPSLPPTIFKAMKYKFCRWFCSFNSQEHSLMKQILIGPRYHWVLLPPPFPLTILDRYILKLTIFAFHGLFQLLPIYFFHRIIFSY